MNDLDWFDGDFNFGFEDEKPKPEKKIRESHYKEVSYFHSTKHLYRRAFSELKLLDLMDEVQFNDNDSYHFITAGNIDSLSFLKVILRKQDLDYCLFSTWCMSPEDILEFDGWLTKGKIKKLDAYVGEIFPGSYKKEFEFLKDIFKKHDCGRVVVFKNHSKIYAGFGEKFHFGIQSSANINTNPRTENANITISKELFHFYKQYFDEIKSFE
jgi:hypothetical protein